MPSRICGLRWPERGDPGQPLQPRFRPGAPGCGSRALPACGRPRCPPSVKTSQEESSGAEATPTVFGPQVRVVLCDHSQLGPREDRRPGHGRGRGTAAGPPAVRPPACPPAPQPPPDDPIPAGPGRAGEGAAATTAGGGRGAREGEAGLGLGPQPGPPRSPAPLARPARTDAAHRSCEPSDMAAAPRPHRDPRPPRPLPPPAARPPGTRPLLPSRLLTALRRIPLGDCAAILRELQSQDRPRPQPDWQAESAVYEVVWGGSPFTPTSWAGRPARPRPLTSASGKAYAGRVGGACPTESDLLRAQAAPAPGACVRRAGGHKLAPGGCALRVKIGAKKKRECGGSFNSDEARPARV